MFEIQCQFSTEIKLVESHRRFIIRGSLTYIGTGDPIWRQCFLFSDLFVVSRRGYDGRLSEVHEHRLSDIMFVPSLNYIEKSFGIRTQEVSYILKCDSLEKYDEWVSAFTNAVQSLHRRMSSLSRLEASPATVKLQSNFHPIWQPDESSSHCMLCESPFGILTRRHHCRFCGVLVCDNCSPIQLFSFSRELRKCVECRKSSPEANGGTQ